MAFPKLLQKLFANSGAGPLLRSDILPIDTALSDSSTNPVQNKIIKAAIDAKTFPIDSALSSSSTNAVQNKVINSALATKANSSSLATVATSGSYSDLSNRPTIPTSGSVVTLVSSSYNSSTGSWYRKWSDGYIEQGSICTSTGTSYKTITFPTSFSSTNYIVQMTNNYNSSLGDVIGSPMVKNRLTTLFEVAPYIASGGMGKISFLWCAFGY